MFTIIAAGGDAKRMGMDKASLPYKGTTMALYLAKKYEELGPVAFAVNKNYSFDTEMAEQSDSFAIAAVGAVHSAVAEISVAGENGVEAVGDLAVILRCGS